MLIENLSVYSPDEGGGSVLTNEVAPEPENEGGAPAENSGSAPDPIDPLTPPTDNSTNMSEWLQGVAEELRGEPSLQPFKSVEDLAKSYVHSRKLLGADKIQVPNKYADENEWRGVYEKLGLPKDVAEYDLKPEEGAEVDEEFFSGFKEAAHQAGILPKQAQQLYTWYDGKVREMSSQSMLKSETKQKEEIQALQAEWGDAWESKVTAAKLAITEYGDDDFKEYLETTGLGNDARVIKLMSKIGENLSEDQLKSSGATGLRHTPADAQGAINEILGNPTHAYFDKKHPDHKRAIDEMNSLFSRL